MQKRSCAYLSMTWAIALAELALAVYAVSSLAWGQPLTSDAESTLASAQPVRAAKL